jgi:protein AroM
MEGGHMQKIGTITIGQAPRLDIIPELRALLGSGAAIVERGALDGLTPQEVAQLAPKEPHEEALVTRLADGTSVTVSDTRVIPRVQRCIHELEEEVSVILLLCTGSFPAFAAKVPMLVPEPLLFHFVRAVAHNKPSFKLGVLTPSEAQIPHQQRRWQHNVSTVMVASATPYKEQERVVEAGVALAKRGADAILLDCMGYTLEMKQQLRARVTCPVILSRAVLARFAAELA